MNLHNIVIQERKLASSPKEEPSGKYKLQVKRLVTGKVTFLITFNLNFNTEIVLKDDWKLFENGHLKQKLKDDFKLTITEKIFKNN